MNNWRARKGRERPSALPPEAGIEPDELGVLNDVFMQHDESAIGRYVERSLIAWRRSKRACGGTHHALIWPRYRRAFARRLDANESLRQMGRDVERSGFAEGEVIAKNILPDGLDLARGTICSDRRTNNRGPGGDGYVGGPVADLDAIRSRKKRPGRRPNQFIFGAAGCSQKVSTRRLFHRLVGVLTPLPGCVGLAIHRARARQH